MTALYEFAAKYALKQPVALNIRLSKSLPTDIKTFGDLCIKHNILDLYVWLANRFPKYFIEHDLCLEQKKFAIKQIEITLKKSSLEKGTSHGRTYVKLRDRMSGRLPAEDYPHIQQSVIENLNKIPKEFLCIIAPEDRSDNQRIKRSSSSNSSSNLNHKSSNSNKWAYKPNHENNDKHMKSVAKFHKIMNSHKKQESGTVKSESTTTTGNTTTVQEEITYRV